MGAGGAAKLESGQPLARGVELPRRITHRASAEARAIRHRCHPSTPLDGTAATALLADAGFGSARSVPTPQGAPGITLARREPGS